MKPDNNSLNRTYFIGGSPRIGKTTLAYALAEKIKGHVVSTDSIRSAAKKARLEKTGDLFRTNFYNNLSEEEWLERHLHHPEIAIDDQNKESAAFWTSIVSFCNTFCEDSAIHIVEGAHLAPSLVSAMENKPAHIIYVGNTNPDHYKSMVDYSQKNPEQDWMASLNYSDERLKGMANLVRHMSLHFKCEAEKYGFKYYEIGDDDFEKSISEIVKILSS